MEFSSDSSEPLEKPPEAEQPDSTATSQKEDTLGQTKTEEPVQNHGTKSTATPNLSKRQKKELKAKEYWKRKRKKRREKKKLERLQQLQEDTNQESLKDEEGKQEDSLPQTAQQSLKKKRREFKQKDISDVQFNLPHVVVDLSFQEAMSTKEQRSVSNQIMRSYSTHKIADRPLYFHVTSVDSKFKPLLDKHDGFSDWKIFVHEESFLKVFPQKDIVYLSPESTNVLDPLKEDKVYIIGGISDNANALKGLTQNYCVKNGIETARLPISEYVPEVRRCVLNINHVFDILVSVAMDGDWRKALLANIPERFHNKYIEDRNQKEAKKKQKNRTPSEGHSSEKEEHIVSP